MIIVNAFVNKTSKSFILLVESNFFAQCASGSPPVFSFMLLLNTSFALWWKWFVYSNFSDSKHKMKNNHTQMSCFWSPSQKGYAMKEVLNVCNGNCSTNHKSLCHYFHHIFVQMTQLTSSVLMKTLLLLDLLKDK